MTITSTQPMAKGSCEVESEGRAKTSGPTNRALYEGRVWRDKATPMLKSNDGLEPVFVNEADKWGERLHSYQGGLMDVKAVIGRISGPGGDG